jgi:hypothetical protein
MRTTGGGIVFVGVALVAFACGGSGGSGGSGGTGPGSGNARYYMTASVDGAAWSEDAAGASTVGAVWAGPGSYTISGYSSANGSTILITLFNIRGPSLFPLGVGGSVPGGTAQFTNTSSGWATRLSGQAGAIIITTLTNTEIAGTFTFVGNGILNASSTSTKTVTSGTFDLPLKSFGPIGAIPDYAGSTISGTIGGTQFNMATIAVTTATTRGTQGQSIGTTLIFGGSTDTQGIGAAVPGVNGPGVYTLAAGDSTNSFNSTTLNTSLTNGSAIQAWNSSDPASVGAVTITFFSPTRVKGSFTANLGPGFGTTARINVSGTFDLGIR